jgi:probable rRNA maturation factor
MATVNETHLNHDGSTDVITFDYGMDRDTPSGHLCLRGELFICVDDAIEQAREFGTTWPSEVIRYVVHGLLHLHGYEDLKPVSRKIMKREENRLVKQLEQSFNFGDLSRKPARSR